MASTQQGEIHIWHPAENYHACQKQENATYSEEKSYSIETDPHTTGGRISIQGH